MHTHAYTHISSFGGCWADGSLIGKSTPTINEWMRTAMKTDLSILRKVSIIMCWCCWYCGGGYKQICIWNLNSSRLEDVSWVGGPSYVAQDTFAFRLWKECGHMRPRPPLNVVWLIGFGTHLGLFSPEHRSEKGSLLTLTGTAETVWNCSPLLYNRITQNCITV